MVWSCCVPRGRAGGLEEEEEFPSENYGVVNDPRKILFNTNKSMSNTYV